MFSPIIVHLAARNIFGLNPPTPIDPNAPADADLPKITANGIMSIFSDLEVLFKTSSDKGSKDAYYDLNQGEREDDIEVVRIDTQSSTVTFNNHGVRQKIALTDEPSGSSGGNVPPPARVNSSF